MSRQVHLCLLVLSAILVGWGYFLLDPQSPKRIRLRRIFRAAALLLPLIYLALLAVSLSSSRGGAALGFLSGPLDSVSRWGEAVFQGAVSPGGAGRTGLAIALAGALGLILAFNRSNRLAAGIAWLSCALSLLAVSYWGEKNFVSYWILGGGGAIALLLTGALSSRRGSADESFSPAFVISLILAVAFLLRFYRLDLLPAAFLDYEGATGLAGIEVLEGRREFYRLLWSFIGRPIMNTYSSPFFAFPLGWAFRVFGVSIITLRSLAALIGTATVPALYLLVRQQAGRREALLAAFFLAVSIWHITVSRVGLSLVLAPLYATLLGWALLRAFRTNRLVFYLLAGAGLGVYWLVYMISKVMLIVAGLLLAHRILLEKGFLRRNWKGLILFFLAILAIATVMGGGISDWLLGVERQAANYIWHRTGPESVYSPEVHLDWAARYLVLNFQKSFRYLFLASHHEFLLPSVLPLINPLVFPLIVAGLAISLYRWKRELDFFFLALFAAAFIPQVLFATFSDKAAPRHLMLLIPPCSFFAARPFSLLLDALAKGKNRWLKTAGTITVAGLAAALTLSSFYITFLSQRKIYPVCRMRRTYAEFIRDRLDRYYFFIVRGKFPLYLQNRTVDFITYPKIGALHYHLPDDYPRDGQTGPGLTKGYRYIKPEELHSIFPELGKTIPRAGFVFEPLDCPGLEGIFLKRFGEGSVETRALDCAPWVYGTFLYPPGEKAGPDNSD